MRKLPLEKLDGIAAYQKRYRVAMGRMPDSITVARVGRKGHVGQESSRLSVNLIALTDLLLAKGVFTLEELTCQMAQTAETELQQYEAINLPRKPQ